MDIPAVFDAVDSGDVEIVRGLVSADPGLASVRDASGVSALGHAAYRGHRGGGRARAPAASGGHGDVVRALLAAAPPLDVVDAAIVGRADVVASAPSVDVW